MDPNISPQALLGPELSTHLSHQQFNRLQAQVAPTLVNSNVNVVVAAPTGGGKTLIMELAMLRLLRGKLAPSRTGGGTSTTILHTTGGDNDGVSMMAGGGNEPSTPTGAAVYICPVKALANEKFNAWQRQFPRLNVVLETGDQGPADNFTCISTADIIVTTPERWDSITRRWREGNALGVVSGIGLLLIDEVHLIAESRGAALEAVVSRMKTIQEVSKSLAQQRALKNEASVSSSSASMNLRFVAVSSTIPNIDDIALWLGAPTEGTFCFGEEDRPVPLRSSVISYPMNGGSIYSFDKFLNYKLPQVIQQNSDGKPTLVFCCSRKDASSTAQHLATELESYASRTHNTAIINDSVGHSRLQDEASTADDAQLAKCLKSGVGFHHAALSAKDRNLVEQLFLTQQILVVCTTTTLAVGVNLPARLVVIKGTSFFKGSGQREDLPLSDVVQMAGRAGRPGFDTEGVAVVMTNADKAFKYKAIEAGCASANVVESTMHLQMIEHLNAEIALKTVATVGTVVDWLKTTFFWVRLHRNPAHYGLQVTGLDTEAFAQSLGVQILKELRSERCVTISSPPTENDSVATSEELVSTMLLEPTRIGRTLARLYISFNTLRTYNKEFSAVLRCSAPEGVVERSDPINQHATLGGAAHETHIDEGAAAATVNGSKKAKASANGKKQTTLEGATLNTITIEELFTIFCKSEEFSECRIRQGDKGFLNNANKKSVRFALKSGKQGGREVRETWQKLHVLFQMMLGHTPITEWSLRNDLTRASSSSSRVSKFLVEYSLDFNNHSAIVGSWQLHRCIENKCWWDGEGLVKQLAGVGDIICKALHTGGIASLQQVLEQDPRKLEMLCKRPAPFGSELHKQIESIPKFAIHVVEKDGVVQRRQETFVDCALTLHPQQNSSSPATAQDLAPSRLNKKPCFFSVVVGHTFSGEVLLHRRFRVSPSQSTATQEFTFSIPMTKQQSRATNTNKYTDAKGPFDVHLINEVYLGMDEKVVFTPKATKQQINSKNVFSAFVSKPVALVQQPLIPPSVPAPSAVQQPRHQPVTHGVPPPSTLQYLQSHQQGEGEHPAALHVLPQETAGPPLPQPQLGTVEGGKALLESLSNNHHATPSGKKKRQRFLHVPDEDDDNQIDNGLGLVSTGKRNLSEAKTATVDDDLLAMRMLAGAAQANDGEVSPVEGASVGEEVAPSLDEGDEPTVSTPVQQGENPLQHDEKNLPSGVGAAVEENSSSTASSAVKVAPSASSHVKFVEEKAKLLERFQQSAGNKRLRDEEGVEDGPVCSSNPNNLYESKPLQKHDPGVLAPGAINAFAASKQRPEPSAPLQPTSVVSTKPGNESVRGGAPKGPSLRQEQRIQQFMLSSPHERANTRLPDSPPPMGMSNSGATVVNGVPQTMLSVPAPHLQPMHSNQEHLRPQEHSTACAHQPAPPFGMSTPMRPASEGGFNLSSHFGQSNPTAFAILNQTPSDTASNPPVVGKRKRKNTTNATPSQTGASIGKPLNNTNSRAKGLGGSGILGIRDMVKRALAESVAPPPAAVHPNDGVFAPQNPPQITASAQQSGLPYQQYNQLHHPPPASPFSFDPPQQPQFSSFDPTNQGGQHQGHQFHFNNTPFSFAPQQSSPYLNPTNSVNQPQQLQQPHFHTAANQQQQQQPSFNFHQAPSFFATGRGPEYPAAAAGGNGPPSFINISPKQTASPVMPLFNQQQQSHFHQPSSPSFPSKGPPMLHHQQQPSSDHGRNFSSGAFVPPKHGFNH